MKPSQRARHDIFVIPRSGTIPEGVPARARHMVTAGHPRTPAHLAGPLLNRIFIRAIRRMLPG